MSRSEPIRALPPVAPILAFTDYNCFGALSLLCPLHWAQLWDSGWKDANEEWQRKVEWHRLIPWNRLGEYAAKKLRKGDHLYVEEMLVSSIYNKEVGKGKNKTKLVLTGWQIKVQSIRKLNRAKSAQAEATPVEPRPVETPF